MIARNMPFISLALLVATIFQLDSTIAQELLWQAGVARVKITPTESMWMAGYAARDKPSEGVEQDLFAKAVALEDAAGTRLVIVTTDLIGIPRGMRDAVLLAVADKFRLPAESLILNASHTHCGPELRVDKASVYGLPSERAKQSIAYAAALQDQLVDLIGQALTQMAPARLQYSAARAGFAMNRRLMTISAVQNSPNPAGPVDHDVPVLKVMNADGNLVAVLFGYACHNTTMSFNKFFGDYAGYAQQFIEQYHPETTALFMTGCGGDQNPYPRRSLEFAEHHGRALANAVETALRVIQPTELRGPLRVAMDEVPLKFQSPPDRAELEALQASTNAFDQRRATALLKQLDEQGTIPDTYAYPMSVARFGSDLTLISLAGEVVVDYSLLFKMKYSSDAKVWVAGYSHDVFGYVPSRRVLLEGGYEGGGAMRYTTLPGPFDVSVEERIVAGVERLMKATGLAVQTEP